MCFSFSFQPFDVLNEPMTRKSHNLETRAENLHVLYNVTAVS